jgi:hypothetical protein
MLLEPYPENPSTGVYCLAFGYEKVIPDQVYEVITGCR